MHSLLKWQEGRMDYCTTYHPLRHIQHELSRLAKNILISDSGRNGETEEPIRRPPVHLVSHFGPKSRQV